RQRAHARRHEPRPGRRARRGRRRAGPPRRAPGAARLRRERERGRRARALLARLGDSRGVSDAPHAPPTTLGAARAVLAKELRLERRAPQTLVAMTLFSAM